MSTMNDQLATLTLDGFPALGQKVGLVQVEIDLAEVLAEKGSALADNDVIEAIQIPAGQLVLTAGIQVVTAANGTTLTADLGITGGDVDQFVDGGNLRAAAGTYCATPVTAQHHLFTAADSIDVLLLTLTGTVSTGKFRVWALVASVSAL